MKSLVIYYSQTGNTKKIAEAIRKGIAKEAGECDIKRLQDVKPDELEAYDLIGIGAPVWSSCPATNVIWFEKSLPETLKDKHFFFYVTHGMTPGRAIIRGVQPLLDKGFTVIGWRDWYGGASLPHHCKPWFTDGHPDEIDLAEAESFGESMVRHSQRVSEGDADIIPILPTPEQSDVIYGISHPFIFTGTPPGVDLESQDLSYPLEIPSTMDYVMELEGIPKLFNNKLGDSKLRINPDKCTGCGLCAKACFCGNIDASVFPPVFKTQNCESDFLCEGICPTGALEYDFAPPGPYEETKEWMLHGGGMYQVLMLQEAQGKFRRLVSEDEIGYDTPWETVTGRPRHKEFF